jgi:hypothetical protein
LIHVHLLRHVLLAGMGISARTEMQIKGVDRLSAGLLSDGSCHVCVAEAVDDARAQRGLRSLTRPRRCRRPAHGSTRTGRSDPAESRCTLHLNYAADSKLAALKRTESRSRHMGRPGYRIVAGSRFVSYRRQSIERIGSLQCDLLQHGQANAFVVYRMTVPREY